MARMKLAVKLFATLREHAGWSEQELRVEAGTTVKALLAQLDAAEQGVAFSGRPLYVAVNQEYAQLDQELHDGDVVALFPPVSGGAVRSGPIETRPTQA